MGRVRPAIVKRIAKRLLEEHSDKFPTEIELSQRFEFYKKAVAELLPDLSKRMRNRVAGHICRLRRIRERAQAE